MRARLAAVFLLLSLSACSSLTHQQEADYAAWESQGTLIREKSTKSAFWLGLLPGGGSFYTRQYVSGVLDLLLWPLSVLWDPAAGMAEAKRINFTATVYAMDTGRIPDVRRKPMTPEQWKAAGLPEKSPGEK